MKTDRLLIRKFLPDDWQDLFEYLSDENVVKYEPYETKSQNACRQEAARRADDDAFFAVCLLETNKMIGNIYLGIREFNTYEIGFVFNARFQKCGYATEATNAIMGYAFQTLGARRIIAMCNPLNTASWRLLERLGLRRESHLRQNVYFKKDNNGDPIWQDTYEYAILTDEWLKNQ